MMGEWNDGGPPGESIEPIHPSVKSGKCGRGRDADPGSIPSAHRATVEAAESCGADVVRAAGNESRPVLSTPTSSPD
jgi:hypothetical protein